MPRIVSFADGFTSATEPDFEGASQQPDFTIADNQASFANITGLVLDHTISETYFAKYQLKRGTNKQDGELMFRYASSAWTISQGNSDGDVMLADSIVNGKDVVLGMSGEQVQYKSGNLGSSGTLKIILERISE
jgi:hypothetical protein